MVLQRYTVAFAIVTLSLLISNQLAYGNGCFKSIISFGDSLADTGNGLHMHPIEDPPRSGRSPFGETYFHRPTGRYSDGRLIIDFIAQRLGLPFLEPFIGGKSRNFRKGVNFAVAGATALNQSVLHQYGIVNHSTNVSLGTQLDWFKGFFATLCKSYRDCKTYLQTSLIMLGEIGGNEYNYAFVQGIHLEVIESLVTPIINHISFTLQELIKLGARTVMVPGNFPIGFTSVLRACCGAGGPYNFNASALCGFPPAKSCDNPSQYVNWDGTHMTEEAYHWIAQGLLEGPQAIPLIGAKCTSKSTTSGYFVQ